MWNREERTDLTPFLTVLTEIRDALRDAQDREDVRVAAVIAVMLTEYTNDNPPSNVQEACDLIRLVRAAVKGGRHG